MAIVKDDNDADWKRVSRQIFYQAILDLRNEYFDKKISRIKFIEHLQLLKMDNFQILKMLKETKNVNHS